MSPKSQEKKCALLQTMVAVKFVFATVQIGCMFFKNTLLRYTGK